MNKQLYIGFIALEGAVAMTRAKAKEAGYVDKDSDDKNQETEGFEITTDEVIIWMPKSKFDATYTPVNKKQDKALSTYENAESFLDGLVKFVEVKACVDKVGGAEWSLKSFAKAALKIFGHKF